MQGSKLQMDDFIHLIKFINIFRLIFNSDIYLQKNFKITLTLKFKEIILYNNLNYRYL
jgi:hypothetical protein